MIEWAKVGRDILAERTDITPEERDLMLSKIEDVQSTGTLFGRVLVAEAQATESKLLTISPTTEIPSSEAVAQTPPIDLTQASETRLPAEVGRLSVATFHDYLITDLKSHGQEIALPKPSAEIVEVYNILASEGYEVAPIAHVDGKRQKVRIGVFETVARPDYTDGSQMYYTPRRDPLAGILERGRTEKLQGIAYWEVPAGSRFAVSWDEIRNYVVPEAIKLTPHLAEQLTEGGIVLDIPDRNDFRSAGQTHERALVANSWEWVQDSAGFGRRCIVGSRVYGGLEADDDLSSDDRDGDVAFRFQAVSRSQPLP